VMADIEQMFYCFKVIPDHRKYLRFIWHEDNCFEKPLVEILCLMIVHKRLLKSQIHPGYGLFSGYGKSLIVENTSIRLMDSTPVLVLCVLNQINFA
jgi:hypothetical protein